MSLIKNKIHTGLWALICLLLLPQLRLCDGLTISVTLPTIEDTRARTHQRLTQYAVSLRTSEDPLHFGDNHFCAGVIISSDNILTAAHCMMNGRHEIMPPNRISVVAGSPNRLRIDETTQIMDVATIITHPKFWPKRDHDIALLRLSNDFPKDNDAIKDIQMVTRNPPPGTRCISFGWGRLFYNGPMVAEAVYVNLTVIDHSHCRNIFKRRLGKSMLCAMPENILKGACLGDSGGPLICNGQLAGIASWSAKQCGLHPIPTVFTNVFELREWIEEASKRPKTCSENSKVPTSSFMLSLAMLLLLVALSQIN